MKTAEYASWGAARYTNTRAMRQAESLLGGVEDSAIIKSVITLRSNTNDELSSKAEQKSHSGNVSFAWLQPQDEKHRVTERKPIHSILGSCAF